MRARKRVIALSLSFVIAFLAASGCSTRLVDFTIISTKNVAMRFEEGGMGPRVEGKDEVWSILGIPLGVPNLEEAIDDAIEKSGPQYDALTDGVVYSYFYWFLLTSVNGFKVEGTPISSAEIISGLGEGGTDVDLAAANILYHSSLGISNEETIRAIGITPVDVN